MIDKEILDAVIPVPTLEELKDKKVAELKEEGFVVTNFHSGGVFYTILMIVCRIKIELLQLARTVLSNMFVTHAQGVWLDLKMADYAKKRKQAQKTRGLVTVSRLDPDGEAIKIPKNCVFKTIRDINGDELRFFTLDSVVLKKGSQSVLVPVEAEAVGAKYNVLQGQISKSLTYIGEVTIANESSWITREGTNTETDDSFRDRGLRSWSELARVAVKDTYINICAAVPGVKYVSVDDQHPRGQGTIDVIVTSEAVTASELLLSSVQDACEAIKAPDDNVLVRSAEIVNQPIEVNVTVSSAVGTEGVAIQVQTAITNLLQISKNRILNELTHADIIHRIKNDVPVVRNVIVRTPETDIFLPLDKVILPETITVNVEEV